MFKKGHLSCPLNTGLHSRLSKPYRLLSCDFSDNYRALWCDPSRVITNVARLYRCLGLCAPSEKQPDVQIEAARPLPRLAYWPRTESQVSESRTKFIDVPRLWNQSRFIRGRATLVLKEGKKENSQNNRRYASALDKSVRSGRSSEDPR